MGIFKLANTFSQPSLSQTGFPSPGAGAQTIGEGTPRQPATPWSPVRQTKGIRSWRRPTQGEGAQRGFPMPFNLLQRRPKGTMDNVPPVSGAPIPVTTPYFSRGANATVQNYGKVLTNPIGGGIVAKYRPQASYGPAAQYDDGAIWWASQVIPTSVNLQGLTSPDELAALLDDITVQAVYPTTG